MNVENEQQKLLQADQWKHTLRSTAPLAKVGWVPLSQPGAKVPQRPLLTQCSAILKPASPLNLYQPKSVLSQR